MDNIILLDNGNAQIIEHDPWIFINGQEELLIHSGYDTLILPLALWKQQQPDEVLQGQQQSVQGIWLSPNDSEIELEPWLQVIPIIALQFPDFRDGRAYSQAFMLRTRLGWTGELRAVGDVLRDQLSHMRQCGFSSFAVRGDKSVTEAIKGLTGISVLYGRSAIEPRPLFHRRDRVEPE